MSFRGLLLALGAASLVALTTGCADTQKEELNNYRLQNADLKKQVDERDARIKAQETDLAVARAAAAGSSTPADPAAGAGTVGTPGMGEGTPSETLDLRGSPITKGVSKKGETTFEIGSDVLFDSGRSTLKPESKKALDKLVAVLKAQYKTGNYRIEGHTDNIPFKKGSAMTNEKLGQNRAQSVVAYLEAHGVAASKLSAVSMADKEPKSTTNQALNRRVTVVIASK
jgi:outer membrane protein OmpA-like peptidoglycan-associated protein